MKLVYTQQALDSLKESLELVAPHVNNERLHKVRDKILDRADNIVKNPYAGRREEYLEHLGLDHRRVIESHYKIIYRVISQTIYITDIFDSRQDPMKMKG
jgi:plasmid stabilization system protein ParE